MATSISHPSWSWGWGDTEEGTGRRSRKGAIEVPELQDIVIQEEPSPAQRQKEKEVQVVLPMRACSIASSASSARRRNIARPERREHGQR